MSQKSIQLRVVGNNRTFDGGVDRRTLTFKSEELPAVGWADAGPRALLQVDFDIADVGPDWAPGTVHTITFEDHE